MFAARYFAPRYFAPRFWPVGDEGAVVVRPVCATAWIRQTHAGVASVRRTNDALSIVAASHVGEVIVARTHDSRTIVTPSHTGDLSVGDCSCR